MEKESKTKAVSEDLPMDKMFWSQYYTSNSTDSSSLLCNSFDAILQALEICANWKVYESSEGSSTNKPKSKSKNSPAIKSISERCEGILQIVQTNYKVNFLTERELNAGSDVSLVWKFVVVLLDILGQLKVGMEKEELNQPESKKGIEVLSLGAQLNLAKVIELITGLGILQHLPKGVTVTQMTSFSKETVEKMTGDVKLSVLAKVYRLGYIMDVMCFIVTCPIMEIRLQRVGHPIITAAIVLMNAPISLPETDVKTEVDYYNSICYLKTLLMDSIDICFLHTCTNPEKSSKFSPGFLSMKSKANALSSMIRIAVLKNPAYVYKHAVSYGSKILEEDPDGLNIYFISLSSSINLNPALLEKTIDTSIWKLISSVGAFLSSVMNGLEDNQAQKEFILRIAKQALKIVKMCSHLSIHKEEADGSTNKPAGKEHKLFFAFGIFTGYYLTKLNYEVMVESFWNILYKDWLTQPTSLKTVTDLIEISGTLLSCKFFPSKDKQVLPSSKWNIELLLNIWRLHFFTFYATKSYLESSVQSVDVTDKLTDLNVKLEQILVDLLKIVLFNENLRLCDFISKMTFGIENNSPYPCSLQWTEESVPNTEGKSADIYLICKPVDDLKNLTNKGELLYQGIDTAVHYLTKLFDSKMFAKSDLLSTLFEEIVKEETYNQEGTNESLEPASILKTLNLQEHAEDCSRLAIIFLMSHFESNIDPIVQNMNVSKGENIIHYIVIVLRKIVNEIEKSQAKGVNFIFKDSLLNVLRTTQTFMDIFYAIQSVNPNPSLERKEFSWDGFSPIIPYIHRLMECKHPDLSDQRIQTALNKLNIRILTHGKGLKPDEKEPTKDIPKYFTAIEESNSTQPYIQANGLLNLRRLLETNDELALQNRDIIMGVFLSALEQNDSYVYLQAIKGITGIGSKWSSESECILKLISDYKNALYNFNQKYPVISDANRPILVTKLGEAITKIIKELGPFAVKHRDHVFDATLCLLQDKDPLVRMSGLSTLAELCEILEIPLQSISNHIWNIIEGYALDKKVEARRAAFYLGTKSLRGINNLIERDGPSVIITTENYGIFLRNANRKYKQWLETESDDQCRLHLQLALEELQQIFNGLIKVSEEKLEKKISILGPPK